MVRSGNCSLEEAGGFVNLMTRPNDAARRDDAGRRAMECHKHPGGSRDRSGSRQRRAGAVGTKRGAYRLNERTDSKGLHQEVRRASRMRICGGRMGAADDDRDTETSGYLARGTQAI